MQNTGMKMKIIFPFLEKFPQKIYKIPNFVTFCDDIISGDVNNYVKL